MIRLYELNDFYDTSIIVNVNQINAVKISGGCMESKPPCLYDKNIDTLACDKCKYHGYNIIIENNSMQTIKLKGASTLEETKKIRQDLLEHMLMGL